jgi:hypothetical protein
LRRSRLRTTPGSTSCSACWTRRSLHVSWRSLRHNRSPAVRPRADARLALRGNSRYPPGPPAPPRGRGARSALRRQSGASFGRARTSLLDGRARSSPEKGSRVREARGRARARRARIRGAARLFSLGIDALALEAAPEERTLCEVLLSLGGRGHPRGQQLGGEAGVRRGSWDSTPARPRARARSSGRGLRWASRLRAGRCGGGTRRCATSTTRWR